MLDYFDYLNIPVQIAMAIAVLFLITQIVGEILEFKGKVAPEFMNIRKYFKKKKQEREMIRESVRIIAEVQETLREVNKHYSPEKLQKRDDWMASVNESLRHNDAVIRKLEEKLDKNNEELLSISIDNKRNAIIEFASNVINCDEAVTKERFNRTFKLYKEYEDIIEQTGRTNGEVDIAYRIIVESYEKHMRDHTFLEDIRGW